MTREKIGCLDDSSPEETEDDVCDKKNDNSENNDKKKELGCLDDTFPEETEDGVRDKKITLVKIMTRKNNLDA